MILRLYLTRLKRKLMCSCLTFGVQFTLNSVLSLIFCFCLFGSFAESAPDSLDHSSDLQNRAALALMGMVGVEVTKSHSNLDLICPPKTHVLKDYFQLWHYCKAVKSLTQGPQSLPFSFGLCHEMSRGCSATASLLSHSNMGPAVTGGK